MIMLKALTFILGFHLLSSCSSLKNPEGENYSTDKDRQARLDSLSSISADSVQINHQFITPPKNYPARKKD